MAPGSSAHALIVTTLTLLIGNHLEQRGSNLLLFSAAGIVPRVRGDANVRVPGLVVGPGDPSPAHPTVPDPVLLIEILSPSNERDTWANVWSYTSIPSVAEILVVSSFEREAKLIRRGPDGSWPERPLRLGPEDAVDLASIGVSFPLAALYRRVRFPSA
jgi:Uma2 family endonuclease